MIPQRNTHTIYWNQLIRKLFYHLCYSVTNTFHEKFQKEKKFYCSPILTQLFFKKGIKGFVFLPFLHVIPCMIFFATYIHLIISEKSRNFRCQIYKVHNATFHWRFCKILEQCKKNYFICISSWKKLIAFDRIPWTIANTCSTFYLCL